MFSAFVDNIPFTATMVPVLIQLVSQVSYEYSNLNCDDKRYIVLEYAIVGDFFGGLRLVIELAMGVLSLETRPLGL